MYISKDILKECKPIYANSTFLLIQDLCTGQEFGFVLDREVANQAVLV